MGKEIEEKKRIGRVHKRAGLSLPAHKLKVPIKKAVGKRRVEKYVDIVVGAHAEYLIGVLLEQAARQVGKEKCIESTHLNTALNDTTSPVYGVFPKQVAGMY